ncbi:MAG: hypothetical protein ACK42I_07705, partial [Thermomicrobium sp.]
MSPQLTAIALCSWSETIVLPLLRRRCETEAGEEALFALLWGMVVPGLAALGLGGLVVVIRRFLSLVQLRKLPTLPVCALTENHVGQLLELQGRICSPSPLVGPVSRQQVVAFQLQVKEKWRKQGLVSWQTKTLSWITREYATAVLDDGTGEVGVDLKKSLIYWESIRAKWRPEEVPDGIPLEDSFRDDYKRVTVAATERYVPAGADVYVLGRLQDTRTVEARIVSIGTERITQQALLAETIFFFMLAVGSLPIAISLHHYFLSAWSQYLSALLQTSFNGCSWLHIAVFTWVPFFAAGM